MPFTNLCQIHNLRAVSAWNWTSLSKFPFLVHSLHASFLPFLICQHFLSSFHTAAISFYPSLCLSLTQLTLYVSWNDSSLSSCSPSPRLPLSLGLTLLLCFHLSDVRVAASLIGQRRQHPQPWHIVLSGCYELTRDVWSKISTLSNSRTNMVYAPANINICMFRSVYIQVHIHDYDRVCFVCLQWCVILLLWVCASVLNGKVYCWH